MDIRFAGTMRFAGDVLATFDCGMDVHRHHSIQVVGSEGSIFVPSPWQTPFGPQILVTRGEELETIEPAGVDPYMAELDDMAAAIAGERAPRLGRDDAVGQARTIEALYRAAEAGHAVEL